MDYQKLFEHMAEQHGLTLLESEMQEIIRIVNEMELNSQWIDITEQKPSIPKSVNLFGAAFP